MNKYSKFLLIAAVALGACNSTSETSTNTKDSAATASNEPVPSAGAAGESISPTTLADQSSPEGVAYMIFEAAKSGDYSKLSTICDAQADGDSKSICDIANSDEKKKNEFQEWFAKGTVAGAPQVDGTNATVPITFGPDGTKKEELKMSQVDGKWMLVSF